VGLVIPTAYVVAIFWGPSFGSGGSAHNLATSLTNYIDGNSSGATGYGETSEFNVITQYYETGPTYITKSRFGTYSGSLYDSSTPSTNVTDAAVQAEVLKMTKNNPRTDTVYEVFLPSTSYSSDSGYTSCGGAELGVLCVSQQLQLWLVGREIRVDAISKLRRVPDLGMDHDPEL
jgi:hypothetical protein